MGRQGQIPCLPILTIMKTYTQEPHKKYEILRQLAIMRKEARKDNIDLNNRNPDQHSRQDQLFVGAFWMLVRLHISKRDNVEF